MNTSAAESLWTRLCDLAPTAWESGTEADWDELWLEFIDTLQRLGDPALVDHLVASLGAVDAWKRAIAADVLGQYGFPQGRPFAAQVTPALARRARCEEDPGVREALVTAIGHSELREWAAELRQYAADPDASVRLAVAGSLPLLPPGEEMDNASVHTLITLSADLDPHVRDWATFALGTQCGLDSAPIRLALRARLDDSGDDGAATSGEAAVGLAKRGDLTPLPYVGRWLEAEPEIVGNLAIEAAGLSGDQSLLPRLRELKLAGWANTDPLPDVIDEAIARLESSAERKPEVAPVDDFPRRPAGAHAVGREVVEGLVQADDS